MKQKIKNILLLFISASLCLSTITLTAQDWSKGPSWLNDAVIYQVYPSSYKDSDGDGIGDLPGIISKLDYIAGLGVSVIWFNPVFVSGWIDGGYDVIDYYRVDPRFGTNDDLVRLVNLAHDKGIKVMLDLVPGHSSLECEWFKQSSEGTNLRYSDYYIWSDRLPDAKAERELAEMLEDPDFMQNTKGKWMKSAYPRAKFYNKNFYASQPSLNYGYADPDPDHPWEQSVDAPGPRAVRRELKNIISFWYDLGVDGFRVDMAASLVKDDKDYKENGRLWREMRAWMDENYPEHVLMAEWGVPIDCLNAGYNVDMDLTGFPAKARRLYFDDKEQANGGCYFSLNGGEPSTYDLYGKPWPEEKIDRKTTPAEMLKRFYDNYKYSFDSTRSIGYIASLTGNHDHLRMNNGARDDARQIKVMSSFVLTMPLPILYYGDEIGIRSLAALPNVEGANHNRKERTGARSPMQWDGSANAGFSTCPEEKIYIPVCPEWTPATSYPQYLEWKKNGAKDPTTEGMITVESQEDDPNSLLNYTKKLISFRKSTPAFWADSDFEPVYSEENPYPMVFKRSDDSSAYLVILNPTGTKKSITLPSQTSCKAGTVLAGKGFKGSADGLGAAISEGKVSYKVGKAGDTVSLGPTSVLIIRVR